MPICFVAQPFKDPYQTRYSEVLRPAITAAGLEPYKVDEDIAADRLIENIEAAITRAAAVLVDISEDNPNVWYELGFSQALNKPLVLISCTTVRRKKPYPFDIRGRKVINYSAETRAGLDALESHVTLRLSALTTGPQESAAEARLSPPRQVASLSLKEPSDAVAAQAIDVLRAFIQSNGREGEEREDRFRYAATEAGLSVVTFEVGLASALKLRLFVKDRLGYLKLGPRGRKLISEQAHLMA